MMKTMFHYCCFACFVIGNVIILFMLKLYAASMCSNGWLNVKCIIVCVCVGFL